MKLADDLRAQAVLEHGTGLMTDECRNLIMQAADELERLQSLAGAVTEGQSFASIKREAR